MILGQNPPGQSPLDKTLRTIPRWTKPPDGQNPPVDKTPLDKTPQDKTPRTTPPPRTKPPRQNHPDKPPPPHPHKTPYKTPQTQTTTTQLLRINSRTPTKRPEDKNLANLRRCSF